MQGGVMTEIINTTEILQPNEAEIAARFSEIVANIETAKTMLSPEEKETIELTPVAKAAGSSDQGYRFD